MGTKDRLADMRRRAESAGGTGGTGGAVYRDTVQLAPDDPADPADPAGLADILQEAERMRGWIHEIEGNTQLMRRLHADPTFHANKHLQAQLEGAARRSHGAGLQLGGALRGLERRLQRGGGARARVGRLQYACTRRLYADALERHGAALQALQEERRRLLHDQLKLTNLEISDEECETLLESRELALFTDNARAECASARLALREAEARREELLRAERALRGVRDLFLQLALLIAAQQERVDSVEYYALQATEHVETGQHQLLKGTVSRNKARKKKISLCICLSAGFLVVLLVLVFT